MGDRRLAREVAVQALYEIAQSGISWRGALAANLERREAGPATAQYAERLVATVQTRRAAITAAMQQALENWDLQRLALVDRCVLEVGATEILFFPDVPLKVVIDEAVDVVRKFSTDESGAFVNGVLDRIARDAQSPRSAADSLETES
jgi:N utilization substance protein B